ncbi:MAG: hypothetical protein ACXVAE_05950, partial [Candidatus Limnocylindrales bacterium]
MARRLAAAAAVLGLVAGLVLVPAVTTAQSAPGTLREGLAPQRRVDLRSAPQADLAHRHAPPVLPRLSRPAAAGAAAPKAAGPSVVVPPSPAFATSSGAAAAVVDHAFAGLDDQNTGACSTPNCPEPPDPWVAVGPNDIVQIVNFTVRVTDRDGGHVVTYDLDTFFDTAAISGTAFAAGDGRILYDSYHQRWIASEISIDCGDGNLAHQLSGPIGFNHIMVSDTSDPRGGWTIHGWKIYGGLPDYPGLGTSRDKIVQSANAFFLGSGSGVDCLNNAGGFAGTKLVAWNWSLNAASAVPAFNTGFDLTRFDWRPAAAAPALSTDASVYTVGLGGALADDDVYYGVLTGTPGATLSFTSSGHGLDLTTLGTVATVSDPDPPKPGQPGSPASLSKFAVDARITDAVWQAGRLWFVSTYTCLPPGGDGVTMHDCTRVTKLHTNGTAPPSRLDDFLLSAPDRDTFMGGVGVDGNGTLHVVYSRSSTAGGDFISSASVYQRASDAAGAVSAEAAIAAGAGTYTLSAGRWGDYVGVPIDPTDTGVVWQADEYANASGGWSTKVARLTAPGGV